MGMCSHDAKERLLISSCIVDKTAGLLLAEFKFFMISYIASGSSLTFFIISWCSNAPVDLDG